MQPEILYYLALPCAEIYRAAPSASHSHGRVPASFLRMRAVVPTGTRVPRHFSLVYTWLRLRSSNSKLLSDSNRHIDHIKVPAELTRVGGPEGSESPRRMYWWFSLGLLGLNT